MSKTQRETVLTVRDLKKYYPVKNPGLLPGEKRFVKAVDGVSFSLYEGQTLGLVGESGCGKSTTGRILAGIETATSGEISVLRPGRQGVQMIFQDPYASLNPRKRIYDILTQPMLYHGLVDREHARERAEALLHDVGLPGDALDRFPHEFSGGQRQRICIAKALSLEPEILICDEPVSALDMSIQAQVLNLFRDLQKSQGLTYLFIAHGLGAVHYISHRTAVMYLGRIVELGEGDQVYRQPLHPYTRMLIASVPEPDPDHPGWEREVPVGETPSAINLPTGCRFRDRCPLADERCGREEPVLTEAGEGHLVACWHSEGGRE